MDPHPATLRRDQQLGVEEPGLISHRVEQLVHNVGADRLEPALGVGEACAQRRAQDVVVGARDELTLRAPRHPGSRRQSRADRDLAVARQEWREQRQQRVQIGRQVDVHVCDDSRPARRPRGPQRPTAPLLRDAQNTYPVEIVRERPRDLGRDVRAGVVRDRDPPRERHVGIEEAMQPVDRRGQRPLLVVYGDDDLDVQLARRRRASAPPSNPRRHQICRDCMHLPSLRS